MEVNYKTAQNIVVHDSLTVLCINFMHMATVYITTQPVCKQSFCIQWKIADSIE